MNSLSNFYLVTVNRAVARTLIGGGGGGVYSYIHVRPTSFFSNQIQIDQFEKKFLGAKHEYINIQPPPPN